MSASEVFPRLLCCTKLGGDAGSQTLYDVKFWPWATCEADHVFAVAGSRQIFICRPSLNANPPYEILAWWKNVSANEDTSVNSIAWTKDSSTGKPLLCVTGSTPKHITIFDIEKGSPVRTLSGHGRNVNELMISPLSPSILASTSEDFTIRLWNLDAKYEKQPCVAMLCGEGHRQPMLSSSFHPNGKWILSGAMDTAVALWAVPPVAELSDPKVVNQEPKTIFYPHFYSTEVHHNYVDCLVFYGDLIISRCARGSSEKTKQNEVLLWKIDGFDSSLDVPTEAPIAEPGIFTRSAFPHSSGSRGFQRLLTFSMPNTDRFYLRFGLLHAPGARPILSMGNQASRFFFWDLQRLEDGYDVTDESSRGLKKRIGKKQKATNGEGGLDRLGDLKREASTASDGTRDATSGQLSSTSRSAPTEKRSYLEDPFNPIQAHHTITANTDVSNRHFATRAMSWSPDKHWLIGVGDLGMITIFYREKVT